MKFFRMSISVFFLTFLFLCTTLWYATHLIILPDFKNLQIKENEKNVDVLISRMNNNIKNIKNIINDYSKWDDTYEFLQTQNKQYIHDNFREGTTTLEDLDIDFIIYSNLNQNVIFSKYKDDNFPSNSFEKDILNYLGNFKKFNSIYIYNKKPLYLVKSEILKSDETGVVNGHIIAGKFITNEILSELTNIFINADLSVHEETNNSVIRFDFDELTNITLFSQLASDINNNISFYSKEKFLFSIKTIANKDILKQGKKTITYFNIFIAIFIFIFLWFIYKNQKSIENYNKELEVKVEERTQELNKTIREVEESNKKLHELSNIDFLTQIRNRRSFFENSEKLLESAVQENKQFCVVLIDLDHFKKVNDIYGHASGDEVLKTFCAIVNSTISDKEVFGRLGGEEFCITFFDKDISFVENIANEIREKCQKTVLNIGKDKIKFTISLGLSCREKIESIDEILHVADEFLYSAKRGGRNRLIRRS